MAALPWTGHKEIPHVSPHSCSMPASYWGVSDLGCEVSPYGRSSEVTRLRQYQIRFFRFFWSVNTGRVLCRGLGVVVSKKLAESLETCDLHDCAILPDDVSLRILCMFPW